MRTKNGFYVEQMAILNPSVSSHVHPEDVFDRGIHCFTEADLVAAVELQRQKDMWAHPASEWRFVLMLFLNLVLSCILIVGMLAPCQP